MKKNRSRRSRSTQASPSRTRHSRIWAHRAFRHQTFAFATASNERASLLAVPVFMALFAAHATAQLTLVGGGLTLVEEGPVVAAAGDPPPPNLATGGTAFVSGELGVELGLSFHLAPNLNDNAYGNSFSWIPGTTDPVPFGGIGFGATPLANIQSIAFGRNNALSDPFTDRHMGFYNLQYTTIPNPDATTPDSDWMSIGTLDYGASEGQFTNYHQTWRRHRFNFNPVDATGLRLLVPDGAAIDEFEIYDVAGDFVPPPQPPGRSQTIASVGDATANGNFLGLLDARFNDAGQIAFEAFSLTGTSGGTADDDGIFFFNGSNVEEIARRGNATANGNLGGFSNLGLNQAGQLAFETFSMTGTSGGTADDNGIFFFNGSSLQEIAREGVATANGSLGQFVEVRLNDSAQIAFETVAMTGTSGGSADDVGIFFFNGSSLQEVAREGDATANGDFATFSAIRLNNPGQIAFEAFVRDTSGGAVDNNGIFLFNGSSVQEIAREGDATANGAFNEFFDLRLNNAGQLVFESEFMTGTSGGAADNNGIFFFNGSSLVEIVREGDTTADGNFGGFSDVQLNDSGQIAFESFGMTGTSAGTANSSGLFFFNGTNVQEFARRGDATANGGLGNFTNARLNNSGQIAFESGLMTGTSGGMGDDNAVFITDGIDLIEVRREGDVVSGLVVGGLRSVELNDFGQVALELNIPSQLGDLIELFTPNLHWRTLGSGSWSNASNWTLSLNPAMVHDVLIDPADDFTVTADTNATVRTVTIGGGTGLATLQLQNGRTFTATDGVTIESNGVLTGDGSLIVNADITNLGSMAMTAGPSILQGDVNNAGTIQVVGGSHVTFLGDLDQDGSLVVSTDGATRSTVVVLGSFSGDAGFTGGGELHVFGDLRVGSSPGSVLMDGNLFLGAATHTQIEIGGLDTGQFDQLLVTGDLALAGDLSVSMFGGFQLDLGQEFLIADVGGILTGQFNGLTEGALVGNFNGHDLFITYEAGNGNDVALTVLPELVCDFSGDGLCDVSDIDMMQSPGPIASGIPAVGNEEYDLNGDGTIDLTDRDLWLAAAADENGLGSAYQLGDANLDGVVDGQDFIEWNANKFTSSLLWSDSDHNADGIVDGQDFLLWNDNKFTSSASITAVPEPQSGILMFGVVLVLTSVGKREGRI